MNELDETLDELLVYANLEGCELGDYLRSLCSLMNWMNYVGPEFKEAYIKEMKYQLEFIKKNTEITERTVTYKVVEKDLEWIN